MIIPPVSIIPKAVITKLQQFASSGGKVIFLGKNPSLLVDKTFLDASEPEVPAWAIKDPSGSITPSVLESLPAPDVKLDKQYSAIKYLHRKWKDADLYFFFNESKEMHAFNVSLEGKGKADIWDAMTGQISSLQGAVNKKDIIEVTLKFDPWETKFIIINR
jgi:hypothetical protein